MGRSNQQIDKFSKKYFNITINQKKFVKKEHRRWLRRLSKDIEKPNPQINRYYGYIA